MIRKTQTILVVGDRVLIRPDSDSERSKHGLFLPPGVGEAERVGTGTIVKIGPGYPVPNPEYTDEEPWGPKREPARYIPLQAKEGDHALFLRKEAVEVEYNDERYVIVPQPAILMLVREELSEDPGELRV
ncbi:MAG: co-chaperone GroES [Ignavibacteriae bacterium]|nr:co-chaperone GroES [Ignavibacteriota bacterium]MCB9217234.1 co-chaperone GroES [Ignavibacteria bacterium]